LDPTGQRRRWSRTPLQTMERKLNKSTWKLTYSFNFEKCEILKCIGTNKNFFLT
jgi:hypothetical protein